MTSIARLPRATIVSSRSMLVESAMSSPRRAAPGVIWLTVLFSGVLAFNRSYQIELDNDALEALLGYPGDRRSIFLGKLAANLTFVLLVEAVIVPLTAAVVGVPPARAFP